MCDSNQRCTAPLWGQGGDIIFIKEIVSDVCRVDMNIFGDASQGGAGIVDDATRVGVKANGDIPTPSPQEDGTPCI